MLSYRHSFHAGNFADVLKHIVLVDTFEYFLKKDKPFDYIDTHSGAGIFNLSHADADKLKEYNNGIGQLLLQERSGGLPDSVLTALSSYLGMVKSCNPSSESSSERLRYYPGSPAIAQYFLRRTDRAWLHELHPQDHQMLSKNISNKKRMRVFCEDGLENLLALLPPASRRALVLIDPSYEVKTEYNDVARALLKAHKKFSTGVYAIWYPVVQRRTIDQFDRKLMQSGIRNIQRFELGIAPDSVEHGMTSSGMYIVNPPWTLMKKMQQLLPVLAKTLGVDGGGSYRCDVLVEE